MSDPIATPLVLSTVVDVFTGDVPQDDYLLEDLFQFSHVINSCTTFVNSLLPPLYFLPSCWCKSLASQGALEVFHNPLCHAVDVVVSQWSKVGRVGVSDGVEAVGTCRERVGILVEHAVKSLEISMTSGPSFAQSGLDQTCLQGPNHHRSHRET